MLLLGSLGSKNLFDWVLTTFAKKITTKKVKKYCLNILSVSKVKL